jgi:hypothetical protein
MGTIQLILLGAMMAWAPSLIIMACLLCRPIVLGATDRLRGQERNSGYE